MASYLFEAAFLLKAFQPLTDAARSFGLSVNVHGEVLSVYGSADKVMNREKYNESKTNLPADFTEIVIDGGCHAYFGMYGAQDGDATPNISNEEQIKITADAIANLIFEE